ncbi:hypothetical protein CWI38_1086p0020 [Hamiltosporidium tvaerminnensis]|uniref:Uncharacterized protein n=1 Tax=Hamiltosporidium tvaerminnensis TaxID=1176355 RepID=A0A4Q9LVP1_9MICR|nr:hypothetical protein CWI38_1086p0020 [Hamiltosporidium tvaerminnensis]
MEEKNKELASKNVLLKEEIKKLSDLHTELLKNNIKNNYFCNRTHMKMIAILDENIKAIENILKDTVDFKTKLEENTNLKNDDRILKEKNKLITNEDKKPRKKRNIVTFKR